MSPSDDIEAILSGIDSPMAVVTAADERERVGCLVGFHGQCSIRPLQWAVWMSPVNHSYGVVAGAAFVAVHFLTPDDLWLAELFGAHSGDTEDKFARCRTSPGHGGVPLIDVQNRMVGRRVITNESGGDHSCMVLAPIEVHSNPTFAPLRFHDVSHITAGHELT